MFSPPLPDGPLGLADSLPHSQPSESTSSLGKRKRSQRSVAVSAVSASSGGFAKSVKDQAVLYNGGDQCWHCSAPKTHIAHVIGLRETVLFKELQAQGRLSITSVNQIENAIPLCPLCHDAFDESSSPGFVFIPTDIQYFLDFEHRDYQRRRHVHKSSGELLLRVSPSATDYLQHQSQDGLIEERACGGLYTCYVLRHYMGKKLGHPEIDHGKSPYMDDKPWQGDPNTALSKAFRVVGAKPTAFPSEIRKALLDLSLLYCENDTYLQDQDSRLSRTPPTEDNPENGDDDLEDNSEDQGDNLDNTGGRALSSTKRLASNTGDRSGQRSPRGPLGVASRDARGNGQGAKEATLKRKADPDEESNSSRHRWKKRPTDLKWRWGPRATSQTAMKFYDDVYHLPHEHGKEVVIAGIAQGHE